MECGHSVKAQRHDANNGSSVSFLESLPENIFNNIFINSFKQDEDEETMLQTLCSVACVSLRLNSSVNKTLSSISSLNLSAFSLDSKTFAGLTKRLGKLKKITLNCLRLNKVPSIKSLLGPHVEELVLLKCCSLPYHIILQHIRKTCPNLRVLTLEISGYIDTPDYFDEYISMILRRCRCLESLAIKGVGGEFYKNAPCLTDIYKELPKSVKVLKIEPVTVLDTSSFAYMIKYFNSPCPTYVLTLTNLSLVLNHITDQFLNTIADSLPLLVDLDLEDDPISKFPDDMSDEGVHSLVRCKNLTSLSLKRHVRKFNETTDAGILMLSKGCKGLLSVRLGGFAQVTDVGFTSILNSCLNLNKFEIQRAPLLTDLTFHDVSNVCRSLVEVKLEACDSVTSKSVRELATCSSLQVVDLIRCESVGDSCLDNISWLTLLTSLNLETINVTDSCIAYLGKGNAPISRLSLRGCKRVSDKGITLLLGSEFGKINECLSTLDLGEMPGITDNAITNIAQVCVGLTELCIRNCIHVTNASVKALAIKGSKRLLLRRLDVYHCTALSTECFEYLKKPLFCGLQWIGIGKTRLVDVGNRGFNKVYRERPWFTICTNGCEVGCHDMWEYHKCHKVCSSYERPVCFVECMWVC